MHRSSRFEFKICSCLLLLSIHPTNIKFIQRADPLRDCGPPLAEQLYRQTPIEFGNGLKIQMDRANIWGNGLWTGSVMRVDFSGSADFLPEARFKNDRFLLIFACTRGRFVSWLYGHALWEEGLISK